MSGAAPRQHRASSSRCQPRMLLNLDHPRTCAACAGRSGRCLPRHCLRFKVWSQWSWKGSDSKNSFHARRRQPFRVCRLRASPHRRIARTAASGSRSDPVHPASIAGTARDLVHDLSSVEACNETQPQSAQCFRIFTGKAQWFGYTPPRGYPRFNTSYTPIFATSVLRSPPMANVS